MDFYLMSIIAFVALVLAWLVKSRKKVERKGILFIRHTTRGRDFIYWLADKFPGFWRLFGDLSILLGFTGMIGGIYLITKQAISAPTAGPGLSVILPTVSSQPTMGFGYVLIPFWYFIASLVIIFTIHEGMHGLQARLAKVKVESMGALFLLLLPIGAFVKPSENQLKRASLRSRLRVYSSGSAVNFLFAGLCFLALTGLTPVFTEGALDYRGYVDAGAFNTTAFPAQEANVTGFILSVDGARVYNTVQFLGEMSKKSPGDNVTITTTEGTYKMQLDANPTDPSRAFIGVAGVKDAKILKEAYSGNAAGAGVNSTFELLSWMMILNFGVGLINMLPIRPLDGGHMFADLFKKMAPKSSDIVIRATAAFVVVVILYTFVGGFL